MEDADESQLADETLRTDAGTEEPRWAGFALAVGLLAVAFVGARTAGVLGTVRPYLLGVSVLLAVLFLVGRR